MKDLEFTSSLSNEEIDANFVNTDIFSGIMTGLEEALICEKEATESKTTPLSKS